MNNQFSQRVSDIIVYSKEEANRLRSRYIGPEHLLLGMLRDGEGKAIEILSKLNTNLAAIKQQIEAQLKAEADEMLLPDAEVPLSNDAAKILKMCILEARGMRSNIADTEHVLLAILRERNNMAASVLEANDVNYVKVLEQATLQPDVNSGMGFPEETYHRIISGFSGGEKTRLAIAKLLLEEPNLLILDEPTNGLDPIGIAEVRNFIKDLSVDRGKTILISSHILSEISLAIPKGSIVSILGPSGCGKTTLLNLILGLVPATSGRILVDGENVTNVPMEKRGFNIVFQDYALFPNLNAEENIVYGLKNCPGRSTPEEVRDLIHLLGLEPHLKSRVQELSGGQKQRVALARTLVMKPRLLLLDEPLSALDGLIKESIKERIRTIARQLKLTTLIVTHDPEEALTLSDKVLIINGGRIAQFDTPQGIVHRPADDFVRRFILSQLTIKRDNIYRLFGQPAAEQSLMPAAS